MSPRAPVMPRGKRRNKYRAERVTYDGIRFDSRRECRRYKVLKLLEKAGDILDLELQPKYLLAIGDRPILIKSGGYPNGRQAYYKADFRYYDTRSAHLVVEDAKGVDTPISRLKRAIVEAQYSVEVKLV